MANGDLRSGDVDPYHFTVEQVIRKLGSFLEQDDRDSFRRNGVTGRVLLNYASFRSLYNELGVKPLDSRDEIMQIVSDLRLESETYQNHLHGNGGGEELRFSPDSSLPIVMPMNLPDYTPRRRKRKRGDRMSMFDFATVIQAEHNNINTPPPLTPPAGRLPQLDDRPLNLLSRNAALHIRNPFGVNGSEVAWVGLSGDIVNSDNPQGSGRRNSESVINKNSVLQPVEEPGSGLAASLLPEAWLEIQNADSRAGQNNRSIPGIHDNHDNRHKRDIQDVSDTRKQQDVQDVQTSNQSVDEGDQLMQLPLGGRQKRSSPMETPHGFRHGKSFRYLPLKARKIDSLFYDVDIGEEIILDEMSDDNFFLTATSAFPGEKRYVGNQIRRMLMNHNSKINFLETVHNGRLRTSVKHYLGADKYLRKYEHQSFTVYDIDESGVHVHRESTETLALPWPVNGSTSYSRTLDVQIVRHGVSPVPAGPLPEIKETVADDWDYLLKWKNIDGADTVLPIFGESGSEGEYDAASWREIEEEFGPRGKAEEKSLYKPLTQEEVLEAIDECINRIVQKWKKILPKWDISKAYRIWRHARKTRTRKKTAAEARTRVQELEERLRKMRETLCESKMAWTAKQQVRMIARGVMQVTVDEIQEQLWLIDLMGRPESPPKPERPSKSDSATPENEGDVEDSFGEDLVDSGDSSMSEEDDGMDSFIVADNVRDVVDGVEMAVEGEEEVAAELSRRNAFMPDSDDETVEDDSVERPKSRNGENMQVDVGSNRLVTLAEHPSSPQSRTPLRKRPHEVIDLTSDSPPARPAGRLRIINLESETEEEEEEAIEMKEEIEEEVETDRVKGAKRVKKVKEVVVENLSNSFVILRRIVFKMGKDNSKCSTIFYKMRDLLPSGFVRWFQNMTLMQKSTRKGRHRKTLLHEEDIYNSICRLFIGWNFCRDNISENDKLSEKDLDALDDNIKTHAFFRDLNAILSQLLEEPQIEWEFTEPTTGPTRKSTFGSGSGAHSKKEQAEFEFSDVDEDLAANSQHRKRKRKQLIEDQTAKASRTSLLKLHKNLRRRIEEQEKRAKERGETIGHGKLVINLGHNDEDKDIFIHEEIAASLKTHQVEGIRFMWQQLCQTGECGRGCLLAHTMGLGKTLQVITLLYTLATTASSQDDAISRQVPRHLRVSPGRTLILSPPGLVENWWDEFHNWLPFDRQLGQLEEKYIGKIYRGDGILQMGDRMTAINEWQKHGGILLMGYQMFRNFIFNSEQLSERQHMSIKKFLLEGPTVVVADEAHNLKNPRSGISQAASQFKTLSRIAMTGSPLSNNLKEYWSMIDWIDPGYLGPAAEFDRKYIGPITDGLFIDSSREEKRISLMMLRVLKKDLQPKISRADIEVIKDEMPQKTEFLVTLPLTDIQIKMYERFVSDPATVGISNHGKGSGNTIFHVVNMLTLLCSHPRLFVKQVEEHEAARQAIINKSKQLPEPDEDVADTENVSEGDLTGTGLTMAKDALEVGKLLEKSEMPYAWARPMLDAIGADTLEHSYKVKIFREILVHSIELDDRVLVFSHSLLTLNLLEEYMNKWNMSYIRLDGKTPTKDRQQMVKDFNTGNSKVYLISTEAGGLGLNICGANRVIIFDFKWTPTAEHQAVGRAYRLGQKKHVFVYRFRSGGTFEDNIWNTSQFKTQLHHRVVDQKAPMRNAHKKAEQYLAPPKRLEKQADLETFRGKDTVLDRLISTSSEYIWGINYTETFQPDVDDALTEEEKISADRIHRLATEARIQATQSRNNPQPAPLPVRPSEVSEVDHPYLQEQQRLFEESLKKMSETSSSVMLGNSDVTNQRFDIPLSVRAAVETSPMSTETPQMINEPPLIDVIQHSHPALLANINRRRESIAALQTQGENSAQPTMNIESAQDDVPLTSPRINNRRRTLSLAPIQGFRGNPGVTNGDPPVSPAPAPANINEIVNTDKPSLAPAEENQPWHPVMSSDPSGVDLMPATFKKRKVTPDPPTPSASPSSGAKRGLPKIFQSRRGMADK